MYHAIMTYYFKPERMNEAAELWKTQVADIIGQQPGFIRVQFYTNEDGSAVAIGSWETQENAEDFMRTGVFAKLLEDLKGMMVDKPRGSAYSLAYFHEA